jgi:hypothetical protein
MMTVESGFISRGSVTKRIESKIPRISLLVATISCNAAGANKKMTSVPNFQFQNSGTEALRLMLAIGPARHGPSMFSDRHGLARGRHDSIRAGPKRPTGREMKKSTARTLCMPGPTARRPGKACLGMAGLFWPGLCVFAYFGLKKLYKTVKILKIIKFLSDFPQYGIQNSNHALFSRAFSCQARPYRARPRPNSFRAVLVLARGSEN